VVGLSGALHRPGRGAQASSASVAAPQETDALPGPAATGPATAPPASAPSPAAVVPVTLQIPSIGVDTSMELLGIAADGTLQTPKDPRKAGWFTGGALPGDPGPVVIAGHVDSVKGPAVFAHLKQIKVGDPIAVTLSGGKRVTYLATSVVVYAKNRFPTESVYGARPDSELRLITCGGAFVQGEYVDNVIVFAALNGS